MTVDQLRDSEALKLVTAFYQIEDTAIRKTIIDLTEAAASGEAFEAKIDAVRGRGKPVN